MKFDPAVLEAALDKHVVLFGMTGAGKTSVIKTAIVEPDLEADRRVLIITPKDDWWGLRLSKTGKSKGFDIPIFGGFHADYALNVKDAALLADAYATMKGSAIFCTSRLSVQERASWFAAFAERLLANNRGWVRVVIDEAHVYMPKSGHKGGGAVPLALHAGNELVSQGRSMGLRIVLASQRSAKLHNDASTQCSCLMAMLLMAPHDRDAVKDWIEDQADPVKGKEIVASLANLNPGEAWVWAPRAKLLDRIQFPRPQTFDSSAAPDDDAGDGPQLSPINLDALKGKLAKVEAETKANDPKELRAELARVTKDLHQLRQDTARMPLSDPKAITAAEQRGFQQAKKKLHREAEKHAAETIIAAMDALEALISPIAIRMKEQLGAARKHRVSLDNSVEFTSPATAASRPMPAVAPRTPFHAKPTNPKVNGTDIAALSKGGRTCLTAAAQHADGVTREQLTVLTGYKRSSRDTFLQQLNSGGLISQQGGRIYATEQGIAALGADFEPLPTGEGLRNYWISKLGGGERAILEILIAAHPQSVERDVISEQTSYKRSSRDTFIQKLSSRELIETDRGTVKAAASLFD